MRALAILVVLLRLSCAVAAQEPHQAPQQVMERRDRVVRCLQDFVAALERDKLSLRDSVPEDGGVFGEAWDDRQLFRRASRSRAYLWALRRLLHLAEQDGDPSIARAVLMLAALGSSDQIYDPSIHEVRDLAHWALVRNDQQQALVLLRHVAKGAPFGNMFGFPRRKYAATPAASLRAAAVRVLGAKAGTPPALVRDALSDAAATVRLAAAEALVLRPQVAAIPAISNALQREQQSVAGQALLHALQRVLRLPMSAEARKQAIEACQVALDAGYWRVQMTAVEVLAEHPDPTSIPHLIELLDSSPSRRKKHHRLRWAVNRQASPILANRAWQTLRQMTGAVIAQDAAQWRRFWEKEKERFRIVQRKEGSANLNRTSAARARFYQIPIIGRNIVFLIDASGSMREPHRLKQRFGVRVSRLRHTKGQVLAAVQNLNDQTRFRLVTFANQVRAWNVRPMRPGKRSLQQLTEWIGALQANGGTNLADALMMVLRPVSKDSKPQRRKGRSPGVERQLADEIFLLSDGLPATGSVVEPGKVLQLIRRANRYLKVRINTIFIGKGEEPAAFLRKLAEENGGVFVRG